MERERYDAERGGWLREGREFEARYPGVAAALLVFQSAYAGAWVGLLAWIDMPWVFAIPMGGLLVVIWAGSWGIIRRRIAEAAVLGGV